MNNYALKPIPLGVDTFYPGNKAIRKTDIKVFC
jgi:hypothetical protein